MTNNREQQSTATVGTSPKTPNTVFHYTSPHGFISILQNRQIWLSDAGFMNDSQELSYAATQIVNRVEHRIESISSIKTQTEEQKAALQKLISILQAISDRFEVKLSHEAIRLLNRSPSPRPGIRESLPFIASFCTHGDILSMWRGYTKEGGYSIEFSTQIIEASIQNTLDKDFDNPDKTSPFELTNKEWMSIQESNFGLEAEFVQIQYGASQANKQFDTAFEDLIAESGPSTLPDIETQVDTLAPLLAQIKHPAFSEEKEVRLLSFPLGDFAPTPKIRQGPNHLVPYITIEFPIQAVRSITVGPSKNQSKNVEAIEKWFRYDARGQYGHIAIRTSDAPLV